MKAFFSYMNHEYIRCMEIFEKPVMLAFEPHLTRDTGSDSRAHQVYKTKEIYVTGWPFGHYYSEKRLQIVSNWLIVLGARRYTQIVVSFVHLRAM